MDIDSEKVQKALNFAYEKHKNQYRKASKIPYIIHPLEVMSILLYEREKDISIDEDLIIAALLHDVNEDCNVSFDEIEKLFGVKVRDYVFDASEPEELRMKCKSKFETWKDRKNYTIDNIKYLGKEGKYLICADKLANLNSILNDIICLGDDEKIWIKFNAPKNKLNGITFHVLKN